LNYYFANDIGHYQRDIQLALYEMNVVISAMKENNVAPNKYAELEAMFNAQIAKTN